MSDLIIDTCDNPVLTDEMVILCEKRLKITLPDNLKEFLYFANGGLPERDAIDFIERSKPNSSLVDFCSISDIASLTIDYEDRIPKGFIVIGEDPGGNKYIMDVKTEAIYFWDHELETEEPTLEDNCSFISNDLPEFIGKLYALEI